MQKKSCTAKQNGNKYHTSSSSTDEEEEQAPELDDEDSGPRWTTLLEHVNSMCSEMVNSSRAICWDESVECFFAWASRKSVTLTSDDLLACCCLTMAADEAVSDVDEMEKQAESSSFRNELDERQPESDELERSCCGEVDELSDVSDAFFNRLTKSSPSLLSANDLKHYQYYFCY